MLQPGEALGILETTGATPAMVALDAMEKRAGLRIIQAELNDFLGVVLKVAGPTAVIRDAVEAGRRVAERMGGKPVAHVLNRPDAEAWRAIESRREFNPLIQQDVVFVPVGESSVASNETDALGFIETQGFTAVFAAIDSACKAANVEVVGKEKLGGGYVTVVIRGDVAAVKTAVETGAAQVDGLGKLIASYVIARPSPAVLQLLPS
jgi:carbon dioxide concentrating mechanism protein CcmO